MNERKWDFKNKLAHYCTAEYSAVFLEELNVRGMLEESQNARNKTEAEAEVGWRKLLFIFTHHGKKTGVTSSQSSQRIRRWIVRRVVHRCTSRRGFASIRARRVGLKRRGIGIRL
jgi:hypothetical protein